MRPCQYQMDLTRSAWSVLLFLVRGPRPKLRLLASGFHCIVQAVLFVVRAPWAKLCLLAPGFYLLVAKCIVGSYLQPTVMFFSLLHLKKSFFCDAAGWAVIIFCCVKLMLILVLIDRASRDDSIGCHVVNIHIGFTPMVKTGCRRHFGIAARFVALFLTQKILKFGSNEAEYTPKR